MRGVKLEEILLFWGGDERGSHWSGPPHDFPFCIPVGSQAPHAAGVAYAFKYRKEARVAVCILGDGATSKGDVFEAMNFSGVWKLPVVFVVNNNQWAISVPLKRQTASETLKRLSQLVFPENKSTVTTSLLSVQLLTPRWPGPEQVKDRP
jgi:pyruvate dehydrogenase E1 component alpha subunit